MELSSLSRISIAMIAGGGLIGGDDFVGADDGILAVASEVVFFFIAGVTRDMLIASTWKEIK